jgi:ATP-dependent protease ClpP protease subunit
MKQEKTAKLVIDHLANIKCTVHYVSEGIHSSAVVIYSVCATTRHMVNNSVFKRNFYGVHVGVQ